MHTNHSKVTSKHCGFRGSTKTSSFHYCVPLHDLKPCCVSTLIMYGMKFPTSVKINFILQLFRVTTITCSGMNNSSRWQLLSDTYHTPIVEIKFVVQFVYVLKNLPSCLVHWTSSVKVFGREHSRLEWLKIWLFAWRRHHNIVQHNTNVVDVVEVDTSLLRWEMTEGSGHRRLHCVHGYPASGSCLECRNVENLSGHRDYDLR